MDKAPTASIAARHPARARSTQLTIIACLLLLPVLWWASRLQPPVAPAEPATSQPATLLITGARVFDGEAFHDGLDVHIADGLILQVGAALAVPPEVERIDGRGHTLLPGLIDAHVHTWGDARAQMLRFGVTTGIDMFSDPAALPEIRRSRESVAAESQADLWAAGEILTAPGGHGTQFGIAVEPVTDVASASAAVGKRVAAGSDFLKFVLDDGSAYGRPGAIPTLDVDVAAALIRAAHARQKMALAHVSAARSARSVIESGADGLVHVWSDRSPEPELVAAIAERGAFVIPTLSVIANLANARPGELLIADPAFSERLDDGQRASLSQSYPPLWQRASHLEHGLANVAALAAAGVDVLAGSDAGNPGTAAGPSLHGELEWLMRAGFTSTQALRAATSLPARRFGLADRGRIGEGLRADLLLVKGDPEHDIRATRAIVRVWKNGRTVNLGRLDSGPRALVGALASRFDRESDLLTVEGSGRWQPTTDAQMGGRSTVTLAWVASAGGRDSGAMVIRGTIAGGAAASWSGASLLPVSGDFSPQDARGLRTLRFAARGDAADYAVLLLSGANGNMPPAVQRFRAGPEWRDHAFELSAFAGADLSRLRAIAIVALGPAGEFELLIDDVELQ